MEKPEKSEHIKRLDVEVYFRGLARSRSEASDLIERGKVKVNGIISIKPSSKASSTDVIEVISPLRFVSRAGEKLAGALEAFQIDPAGLEALDIGSSTGGFTDCLLKAGARKVVAVDVGTDQLVSELRTDPRVELHESTDIRRFSLSSLVDLAVADVSFISLSHVLPKIYESLKPKGRAIILVKPQFEVGMEIAKKFKGVITDEKLRQDALERIKSEASKIGFSVVSEAPSPIEGEKGNKEFLLLLARKS